ncbi:MAG: bifunctional proline dehydrogenase/L-glutamate gamma-semialdehyde dehydrogenase PutA [Rhodospirillales bacterium]|nr:bifunctional proline dehydrogenase/L-glutamate gamma-semialdehyde dehydrogenase PutA [Rhodospirillales bacterium]
MDHIPAYVSTKFKNEADAVAILLQELDWSDSLARRTQERAISLIDAVRSAPAQSGLLESFLQQYPLESEAGRALMTLAEAFLRIPDNATRNALVRDRLQAADWGQGKSPADWFTRFAGVGLMASKGTLNSLLGKLGEPFIRKGVEGAMKKMGQQFVLGETIDKALQVARDHPQDDYSFDMLGEGARTAADADKYFNAYVSAIETIGRAQLPSRAGISVKLSALHPRYEVAQTEYCLPALTEKLHALCDLAATYNLALTVDAEEADRLELSLEIFDHVLRSIPKDWEKFGLALQAYQKRALPLIDHLALLTGQAGRKIRVRLVKGAYWDTEIKRAQVLGLPDFPVFTRKCNTDLSYLTCAQKLLQHPKLFYPMFGTHNAYTIAAISLLAEQPGAGLYEFQRLHGMGEMLYRSARKTLNVPVTVYAPVGAHQDLLPYLVRRLLENGANTSFVHHLMDSSIAPSQLAGDPVLAAKATESKRHRAIDIPPAIFPNRVNSSGLDLSDPRTVLELTKTLERYKKAVMAPAAPDTSFSEITTLFLTARGANKIWNKTTASARAALLLKTADLFEKHKYELMAYLVYEGRKTLRDADSEVREAIDFCRYYATQGASLFSEEGDLLPGPTGEHNLLRHEPRGTFLCISPWNFPLAIFTGQLAAALMAGNTVIAKPAEQTPKIAGKVLELMLKAGLPKGVLQIAYGAGELGAELIRHRDVAGVAFTGSTSVARLINRSLAAKDGPIVPLIAETGGQNAMIVDSTALPEQVVDDVIRSAFGSAGQRCSALRVLYVQNEIADKVIEMLRGAMQELNIGDPAFLSSDIGPVIDGEAHNKLTHHKKFLDANARKIGETSLPPDLDGTDDFYFAPCAFEIKSMEILEEEIFGPILHVIRYNIDSLEYVLREINQSGYGLTFGLHSRLSGRIQDISGAIKAGNLYINRSMIGAVVGSQPFGGRGLSGTGPKAGGPNYLKAFATEKVISTDTTASGGNASLVSLQE